VPTYGDDISDVVVHCFNSILTYVWNPNTSSYKHSNIPKKVLSSVKGIISMSWSTMGKNVAKTAKFY
jgi:hypothetical protein